MGERSNTTSIFSKYHSRFLPIFFRSSTTHVAYAQLALVIRHHSDIYIYIYIVYNVIAKRGFLLFAGHVFCVGKFDLFWVCSLRGAPCRRGSESLAMGLCTVACGLVIASSIGIQ